MSLPVLGIDVSKAKFQASLLVAGKARNKSCTNDPSGFADLATWLERQGVSLVHACMEATGSHWERLATFLAERGHVVSVVNPAQIVGFAKSELIRTKTDGVDAGLIAACVRGDLPLALYTRDRAMARAARAVGVVVVGSRG